MNCRFSHAEEGAVGGGVMGGDMSGMGMGGQGGFPNQGGFNQGGFNGGGFNRSRGVCYDWQKGICQRGDGCRFSHSNDAQQGAPQGGQGGYSNFGGNQQYGNVRPGDWSCPSCQVNNFSSRTQCFKCQTPKGAEGAPIAGMEVQGGLPNQEMTY
jgi:hypothetical protein